MTGYILDKTETLSRGELAALQSERLQKTVRLVYDNVPVYRAKMEEKKLRPEDIRSVEDLHKLPFTTKQDLRANYPFGMFASPKEDIVRIHASSGTTGKLTVVGYTQNDLDVWTACMARSMAMAGIDRSSTVQVSYGYGLFTGGLGAHYGAERLGAAVVPTSSGNTLRQITLMKDFGVTHLCCTPSYALYIADEIRKMGLDMAEFELRGGLFGAEPWSEAMRGEIEKKLNITALDIYGLSEISGPGVAMECGCKAGSHIQEDHFIPEIVDSDTLEPLPYGQTGELVFTTITKTGQPLIRYRTRDITSLNAEPCACGRTTVRMNKVFGRSDDMLIIRGVNVFPSQIETVLIRAGGIEPHYQINVDRVNNTDVMEIEVEMTEEIFSDEVRNIEKLKQKIESMLYSMLGVTATVRLVGPNTIPRSEGKAKRINDRRTY